MSKPLVFVLHGMGINNDDNAWVKPFITELNDAVRKNNYAALLDDGGLEARIDFVPISYDSYFSELLSNWEQNARQIIDAAGPMEKTTVEHGLEWLSGASETEDNFIWSHSVDVFLWRFSPYVRKAIKSHVGKKIAAALTASTSESTTGMVNCSVVSHSLGTAVVSQVLTDLARGAWSPDDPNGFSPSFFRFTSLHTVANVSRILEMDEYPVYSGVVQPGPAGEATSYCLRFFNYRNLWDPFTLLKVFEPPWHANFYNSKVTQHIHDPNVHAMSHYAIHPIVHISMLRSFLGFGAVSRDEELDAIRSFKDVDPTKVKTSKVNEIRAAAEKARTLVTDTPDVIDLMKGIALFRQETGQ